MRLKNVLENRDNAGRMPVPGVRGLDMPYVIAEAGVNHEGCMETAKRLIDEACQGGAHAVKFQTYRAGTLASRHSPAYWDTEKEPTASQYELFKKHDRFWKKECEELRRHCDAVGVEFLSTPFDIESAGFLNDLMDVFKISSSDLTNKPFIRHICGFGKPVLLSTGAAQAHEVMEAVSWITACDLPLGLMHCVLNYPTPDENASLGMITALRQLFPEQVIGYSDHTLPNDMRVLETAVLLGARVLEKHFTHDKTLPGNDHYHAMDRHDLRRFMDHLERLRLMTGPGALRALDAERPAREHARRSLVAARALRRGEVIAPEHLTWKRPAHGISPREYDVVLGMRAGRDIPEDTPLTWSMLE